MAQSIVTRAFEAWIVNKILNKEPARPDKMIFALVPGQDENAEIDRGEGMPEAGQIQHTADITQYGALNENAVVYSVVLDTTIGNWDYNWVGLLDSASNTVMMIVHIATQSKIKTENGQQGNSLIRNLSMQFDGAAAATQITVTPETWQIDFSARLQSMDESRRLANVDYYGDAAFRDEGFKVSLTGSTASIAPGLGYVAGLRALLDAAQTLAVTAKTGIWVDICWEGTVIGAWANRFTLRAADQLENYIDPAGYQHYVTRIASIDGAEVTDERKPFPLDALEKEVEELDVYSKGEADARFLQVENNLSEIAAAGAKAQDAARKNLAIRSNEESDQHFLHKSGDTATGQIIAPSFASTPDAVPLGSGTYAEQLNTQAPFFQPNWQWPVTTGGVFVPIAKGVSTRKNKGWPTAVSYGYLMPGEDMHAHPVIHALGDGGLENIWEFDTQTGGVRSGKAGEFATQNWVRNYCPFPVGYVMLMGNNTDPRGMYPGTDWQDLVAAFDGRVLALGYDPMGTGGNNEVTLGAQHIPPHDHGLKAYPSNTALDGGTSSRYSVDADRGVVSQGLVTGRDGGTQAFSVQNAYVHVRAWMRVA
ncbi:phage tail protein [Serratia marcescens]